MKRLSRYIGVLLLLPLFSVAQKITYSANTSGMDAEILGKVNGNILIFKNNIADYVISIYKDAMVLKQEVALDFIISSKAFNVNFIIYPDFFYIIYQFRTREIVYCMAVKMDGNVKKMNEPVILDTTHVGVWGVSKIYSLIASEDKRKIMIYKIQDKVDWINFVTLLYDDKLQMIHETHYSLSHDEFNNYYSDFHLDNEGNLIFTRSIKLKKGEDLAWLDVITKGSLVDTFSIKNLPLNNLYIDEIKIKVDNVNKRYLLNSFFHSQQQGDTEGIFSAIWDAKGDSSSATWFIPIPDSIRKLAKESGGIKDAFNDYSISKIILKKEGGYIFVAEDCFDLPDANSAWRGNNIDWNRHYDNNYYKYFNKDNSRFYSYHYNIFVCGITNNGTIEWSNIIPKSQPPAGTPKGFATFILPEGIHFLYNSSDIPNPLVMDDVLSGDGKITRNPTLRTHDKGCIFNISGGKMVAPKQLIVPCNYRGHVSFAKIDF